jgi:hypothetical protein
MKCPLCNKDMRIAASFLKSREQPDGGAVYSVVDFMCTDAQCPNGKKKIPVARRERPAMGPPRNKNAVTCCGEPLCYVSGPDYWAPEENKPALSDNGGELSVTCRSCGKRHTIELGKR